MSEKLAVTAMALLALLSLWLAPWAAINRETGARSAVLLLPNRVVDFTGRTDPVEVPGQRAVLWLSVAALAAIAGGAALGGRRRPAVWLVAGFAVVAVNAWGLARFGDAIDDARVDAVRQTVQEALDEPRDAYDLPALRATLDGIEARPLTETVTAAGAAGLRIRRLPFTNTGFALAAFLNFVAGAAAMLFGLRLWPRASRALDRLLVTAAVPAISILLALVAAAVVVLALQPTPVGRGVSIDGGFQALVGRLDTLWYAYLTLFSNSLGTFEGFTEALKFATPLIFTGLAVAFGFQAGLFNIGAPGQMVLGSIAAMLAGIYLPGPAFLVLPAAVLAAALGGGLWGALPGWLKARFGANEVITTILLNFVASALLLFILSSNLVFAAAALRIFVLLGVVLVALVLLALLPPVRRFAGRSPRLALAAVGVVLLVGVVAVALPRPGDAPVNLSLPFKVPGSEPKSQELSEAARLPQLPVLFGFDPQRMIGVQQASLNAALLAGGALALLALWALPRLGVRRRRWRLLGALGLGAALFGVGALLGWTAVPFAVPPSKLNFAFVLAIATAVFMQYFLWRTKWGFELRAVGLAPAAAEYGGASIARNVVLAMAISGAFAGLTATHYVLGGALEDYSLRQSIPTNDGFDGIAVALLGGNAPLGIVLSAFLFGVLKNGGSLLNITFPNLTRDVVSMVLALVVLFIAARGFLPERFTDPLRRAGPDDDVDRDERAAEPGTGSDGAAPDEVGAPRLAGEPARLDPPGRPARGPARDDPPEEPPGREPEGSSD